MDVESKSISSKKVTHYRWVIMALLFVIYTLANADRANLGVALPFIRKEFPMTNTEAGLMISLFFASYAIFQIPVSFLYRKFGARTLMTISMLLTSTVTGLIGGSSSLLQLKICRVLLGAAEAPMPAGCSTTIDRWFPPKEKGTAAGFYWAASKFGPVICPPLCVLLLGLGGWRHIFLWFAIPGVVLSIVWFILARSNPGESPMVSSAELEYIQNEHVAVKQKNAKLHKDYYPKWLDKFIRIKRITPLDSLRKVLCSWNIIGNAISWLCMVGIVNVIMAWIPTYLVTVKHFTMVKMGALSSAPFVGAVLGNMVGGWISDRLLRMRRKPLMMVSALSTSIMMYSLVYAPDNPVYLGILLFLLGFLLSLGYSAFTVYPMGIVSKDVFPQAISVINTCGSIGSTTFPLLSGMLLDSYNWNVVFLFLSSCSIFCLIVIATINEPLPEEVVAGEKIAD
jgi:Sugar phosphate permease